MTRLSIISIAALFAASFTLTGISAPAVAATAEPSGLDSKLSARVARERIKQRSGKRGSGGQSNADCGSVDIGNANSNQRGARQRVNPRETTIIVTGPIINAAKCK